MKKRMISIATAFIIAISAIGMPYSANAKTLAESFSGGSYYTTVGTCASGTYYTKTSWASTYEYYGRHYVRAYIGGTKNNASGAWADTGRVYSNGNIIAVATTSKHLVPNGQILQLCFPTAYAKYGAV